jgi:hypothetical protein
LDGPRNSTAYGAGREPDDAATGISCIPEPTDCNAQKSGCDDRYIGVVYTGSNGCPATVCYPDFEG